MDKTHTHTHFIELTPTELQDITGGDSWLDNILSFLKPRQTKKSSNRIS